METAPVGEERAGASPTVLVRERTRLKQRIHATLAKCGIQTGVSDLFGVRGRELLKGKFHFPSAPDPLRHRGTAAAD